MTDEKRGKKPTTEAQRAARRTNMLEFRAGNERPAMTHGVRSTIAHGTIPPEVPGASEMTAEVDAMICGMVADLGGESEVTNQQHVILEAQRLCLLVLKLAGRHFNTQGLLNKYGKPNALLGTVVSFVNAARLNSMALGLERRARKIGPSTLAEYLETRESEPPQESEKVTQ